jgi:UDP-2-acetamido-2-deoxy-ribo-hexuluronate aminotransferase
VFDDEVAARIRIGARYTELIGQRFGTGGSATVRAPYVEPFNTCVFAQYTIEVGNRDVFETRMKALGVPTAVHYPLALHMQPVFANLDYAAGSFPLSEAAARRVISLPMHPYLTDDQQRAVVDALAQAVA